MADLTVDAEARASVIRRPHLAGACYFYCHKPLRAFSRFSHMRAMHKQEQERVGAVRNIDYFDK
jgi:hypothetical protein